MDDSSSSHDPRRRLSTPQQHRTVGPHDRHDPPGYSTPSLAPASSLTFSPSHRPRVARIDSTDRKRRLTAGEHGRTYPYVAPGSSRADPLDLTQISPPWPNRGQNAEGGASMYPVRRESRIPDREVMPPRWEPDSTVSKCPVCETDFGLFFRKHHCRKCGRVVCGMCSPHRITIPREYIVQPPTAYDTIPRTPGGAEVVRVCKPCVHDPWTPDSQPLPSRGLPTLPISNTSYHVGSGRFPGREYRHSQSESLPGHSTNPLRSGPPRIVAIPPQAPNVPGFFPAPARRGVFPRPPSLDRASEYPPPPPPPAKPTPPPRRQAREEDECPVCGIELAPGEALREEHVQACISSRFGGLESPVPSPRRDSPLPAPMASSSTPPLGNPNRLSTASYRSRGIFPYVATEKDCLDGDGREQECTICMEEFQPGDEMGRLECLCKFHRTCIRGWWARKGPGVCPVHVTHE